MSKILLLPFLLVSTGDTREGSFRRSLQTKAALSFDFVNVNKRFQSERL